MSVEASPHGRAAKSQFIEVRQSAVNALLPIVTLPDVIGKLLPQAEWDSVHQMDASDFGNVTEFLRLALSEIRSFLSEVLLRHPLQRGGPATSESR